MTHTPGPWKVDKNHKGFVDIRRDVDSYTSDIAIVWDFYAESNASLIASAPDMLEVLEEVVALTENLQVCPFCGCVLDHRPDCLSHEIDAAIRKARGKE